MRANGYAFVAMVVGAIAVPDARCIAGEHHHKQNVGPACYKWELCEVEEQVDEVVYKQVKKTVSVPVIKEKKRLVHNPVPVARHFHVLEEMLVPQYKQSVDNVSQTVHEIVKDDCGNCLETCRVVPQVITCLTKCIVPIMVPTLKWTLIVEDQPYYETYLVQEMEDQTVLLDVPVRTPKVVTKRIWKKVPTCAPCETCQVTPPAPCEGDGCPVVVEPATEVTPESATPVLEPIPDRILKAIPDAAPVK